MSKCSKCIGTGFVQTSFGPKPCPTCHGTGYVDSEGTTVHKYKTMSIVEILLYSAIAGVVGFFYFCTPLIFLAFYCFCLFR